jgi:hypothetical protein
VRQKQNEAERWCMQPMAPSCAGTTGRAGTAALGCASQTEGRCMHESVSISPWPSPTPIGGGGGVLRCMGRVLDTAAKAIAPISRIACAYEHVPQPQRRAPASPDRQQVSRRRTTPFSAPVCSFRPCPSECSSPVRSPLELSGQALVWSLGQLLSLQASFAGRS